MSVDDVLTEDDRQLLGAIDDDIDGAETSEEFEAVARELRDKFARHQAEFRKFKHAVEQRLDELEDASANESDEDVLPIIRYARIPEDERDELLGTSDQIAVTIHDNWSDVAWKMGVKETRKMGVDTKTRANAPYNPSKLKHRLKPFIGRDVQWNELYRGMKRLAVLSGGEEKVDNATNRVQISGGVYEYREMLSGKDHVKRVLWRVER